MRDTKAVSGRASRRFRAELRRRTTKAGTGSPMPFSVNVPRDSSSKNPATRPAVSPLITTWPGAPAACRRAAMFGTCPHRSGQALGSTGRHRGDQHLTGMDAGTGLEVPDAEVGREFGTEADDVLDDGQPGRQCVPAGGLRRLGVSEVGHRAVTLELGDHPAVTADEGGDAMLVGVEHVVPILGIEGRRQLGRPHQVGEHHGQLSPLGPLGRHRHAARTSTRPGAPPAVPLESWHTTQIYVCPGRSDSPSVGISRIGRAPAMVPGPTDPAP